MSELNAKRVIAGGLVAGLAINIGYGVAEAAMAGEIERMTARLALEPAGTGTMLTLGALGFVVGLVVVWLYAAIRPRYGPGPITALRAGIAVWTLACLVPNLSVLAFGILTPTHFWMASLSDAVVVPVATLAGAAIYRERGAEAARAVEPLAPPAVAT
jgi:hypothetical protein